MAAKTEDFWSVTTQNGTANSLSGGLDRSDLSLDKLLMDFFQDGKKVSVAKKIALKKRIKDINIEGINYVPVLKIHSDFREKIRNHPERFSAIKVEGNWFVPSDVALKLPSCRYRKPGLMQ